MVKIFISYRRADSAETTTRLNDRLVHAFGRENVFKDVDSLLAGDNFPNVLREWVSTADVVLTVIGQKWLTVQDEDGRRRLDNPNDWVRIETEMALKRGGGVRLIPTLVDGAAMPKASALPKPLEGLPDNNGQTLRTDHFHDDVSALIKVIQRRSDPNAAPQPVDLYRAHGLLVEVVKVKSWDAAREIIASMRSVGNVPAHFQLDDIENYIYTNVQAKQRDSDYEILQRNADLVDIGALSAEKLLAKLEEFWQIYPPRLIFDPANLFLRYSTSSVIASVPPPAKPRSKVYDILPAPFEWVDIPAGPVTLVNDWDDNEKVYLKKGQPQTVNVPAFSIAKYPVTNDQFRKFIDAGGYKQQKWWTPDGWQVREKEKWVEPRFWTDQKWNRADYPVVGVSWYEAIAFCNWMHEASGENIILPTEPQWQRAAQARPDGSDSGRGFPWGDKWESGRCNNSVSPEDSNSTTPVTQYEGKGDSLCGAVDLSGNVWEWCLTAYLTGKDDLNGTDVRVLRGGSWFNNYSDYFRADYRNRLNPNYRVNNGGFRISRSL